MILSVICLFGIRPQLSELLPCTLDGDSLAAFEVAWKYVQAGSKLRDQRDLTRYKVTFHKGKDKEIYLRDFYLDYRLVTAPKSVPPEAAGLDATVTVDLHLKKVIKAELHE